MFANIKNRFMTVIAPDAPIMPAPPEGLRGSGGGYGGHSGGGRHSQQHHLTDKFAYARPPFLQLLTHDELKASADHNVRPIIVPRDIAILPWGTGYAECVNSGKSEWNEDQAAFSRQVLSDPTRKHPDLPYTYFGIFDGHAGYGAALAASYQFHHILHEKLVDIIDMLLPRDDEVATEKSQNGFLHPSSFHRVVSKDELIIGALESAFFNMDALIAQDRDRYRDAGGCTALVSLFICGKMFVANAGDSRGVLCQRKPIEVLNDTTEKVVNNHSDNTGAFPVPFSFDHTPETERHRLMATARLKPNLMGKMYAAMEYAKRPHAKDLGQRILCRQGTMKGWVYKTLTREDLRMPVVTGEGKRSRLLGTLGVTRGFGDHDLLAINTGTQIKPFLTPHPEVNYRDLSKIVSIPGENNEDGDYGILVMATDGLWDVSENENVSRTVFQTLAKYPTEKHRYTMAAQELVAKARGKINDSGHWRLTDSKAAATVDDISVIVIPVYQYYKEHVEYERKCAREAAEAAETAAEVEEVALQNGNLTHGDVDDMILTKEKLTEEKSIIDKSNGKDAANEQSRSIDLTYILEAIRLEEKQGKLNLTHGDVDDMILTKDKLTEEKSIIDESNGKDAANEQSSSIDLTYIPEAIKLEEKQDVQTSSPQKSNNKSTNDHQQQQQNRNRKLKR